MPLRFYKFDEYLRMFSIPKKFTQQELDRVKAAVTEAEAKISGEIVVYYSSQSADYPQAKYISALFFIFLKAIGLLVMHEFILPGTYLFIFHPVVFTLILFMAGVFGYFAASYLPFLKQWLVKKQVMANAVRLRSHAVFTEANVHNTKHKTGILIYISELEHRVEVIGDLGISAKVKETEWNGILSAITSGLKSGQRVDGICTAVRLCGELLLKYGFVIEADDTNELNNDMIIKE